MQKFHMYKSDREIKDTSAVIDILKRGKYTTIGLSRSNMPYVVTLSYGYNEIGNCIYLHSGQQGLKIEILKDNPIVCGTVVVDKGYYKNECGQGYASVVYFGKIRIVGSLDEKKEGMETILRQLEEEPDAIRSKALQSDASYDRICVMKITIDDMTGKEGR